MVGGQRGVTLIELMIVVVITLLLVLLGVPLASRWTHGSHVTESYGLLMQGYDQLRAVALRNPDGVAFGLTAAGMKLIDGRTLLVCRGNPAGPDCDDDGSALAWSADLVRGNGVQITIGGDANAEIALDNTGMPITTPTARDYVIRKGAESREGRLQ